MRVDIETRLDASIERVWAALKTPALLMHVAAPLVRFRASDPPEFPEVWSEGRYRVGISFLGVLPLGRQWVVVSTPEPPEGTPHGAETRCIRDNGTGDLVKVWDHWIFVRPAPAGGVIYRDRVDVQAGVLTPFIWLFAQVFYRHRQARWRALAKRWREEVLVA